jgi:hypothetical protein
MGINANMLVILPYVDRCTLINLKALCSRNITRRSRVDKCIIMTNYLSNIVAQEETFTRGNSKKMLLKDLMAEEGSNLKLIWVPSHSQDKKEAVNAVNFLRETVLIYLI